MPELLTPGVFIQEVAFGPEPIEGVSTSTAGFVGETERGPSEGDPVLVTSFPDFQRKFGGFVPNKVLPRAIRGFFDNGGRRAFIARVVGSTAAAATGRLKDGYDVELLSSVAPQTSPTIFTARVGSVVGADVGEMVTIINKAGTTITTAEITAVDPNGSTLQLDPAAALTLGLDPTKAAIRYMTAGTTDRVVFAALFKGSFGNRIQVRLVPKYLSATFVTSVVTPNTTVTLSTTEGLAEGQILEVITATGRQYATIDTLVSGTNTVTFTPAVTGVATNDQVRLTGWRLDVVFDGATVETIDNISSDNLAADGITAKVNNTSGWVRVTSVSGLSIARIDAATTPYALSIGGVPTFFDPNSGVDGTAGPADFVGSDVVPRTGLRALEALNNVNIIAAPGQTSTTVVGELIGQAERRMDRFAVFESDDDPDVLDVLSQRNRFNSRFAAMYHPWVKVLDPLTNTEISVPPSGHVIGCYARTDNERGVFKAPANVVLRGITGFTRNVPDGEQDLLNPAGVDVLRHFDGLGDVIWGARTISSETLWKYVPVRRLFIFIEQSIVRGTRFAVFEPNDQRLWARIRDAVTNFLTTQWRAGALFGAKPEEAFFVKVDETTTTQDDRDNGRVNIVVGIAPVKPAEFVVFLIGQAPQSVIISEQA